MKVPRYSSEELCKKRPSVSSAGRAVILRDDLVEFAETMENKLRQNDIKKTWKGMHIDKLLKLLLKEVDELKNEIERPSVVGRAKSIRDECADVANFAMMVADVVKISKTI